MNLQGKINVIKEAKDDIKLAIIAKGVIPSGNISTYAAAIEEIDTTNNTGLTVTPSTTSQTFRPTTDYTGYDNVVINAVTSAIDNDIVASNIKQGVEILGVSGTCEELSGQTKTITLQGTYVPDEGYNGFTEVVINTPIGNNREIKNNTYQMPSTSFSFSLPQNVTNLGDYVLSYAFYNCQQLTSVDLSSLTTISGQSACYYAFNNCDNLVSVDLSNLTSIDQSSLERAFDRCSALTSIDLSNLTSVKSSSLRNAFSTCASLQSADISSLGIINGTYALNSVFSGCNDLVTLDLSSLTTISGSYSCQYALATCNSITTLDLSSLTTVSGQESMSNMFKDCSLLEAIDLSGLTTISGNGCLKYAFLNCTSLASLAFPSLNSNSFGSYTNQFDNMLAGVTGCTVHFPSNLQSVIGSWTSITNGFGGTNTVILFDLTETT